MVLTGEDRPRLRKGRQPDGGTGIGKWFSNMAAEKAGNGANSTQPRRSYTIGPEASATPGSLTSPRSGAMSFLQSGMSALQRQLQQPQNGGREIRVEEDELYKLNIEAALFPGGAPPTAASTPDGGPAAAARTLVSGAEFGRLQDAAAALLGRFQESHRHQARALAELRAERSLAAEREQELAARARQLEVALGNARDRARENDEGTMAILEELTAEKKARLRVEQAAREKGVVLLPPLLADDAAAPRGSGSGNGSIVTEDLGAESDQRRRKWMRTLARAENSNGDEDVDDTDEESFEDGSVFSRSRSPTIAPSGFDGSTTTTSAPTTGTSPSPAPGLPPAQHKTLNLAAPPLQAVRAKPNRTSTASTITTTMSAAPQQSQQQGAWMQKIIRGISGDGKDGSSSTTPTVCSNCRGQKASAAWDTVSLLRDENRELKTHRAIMQVNIDEALDILSGRDYRYSKK